MNEAAVYAGARYLDRTRALELGEIVPSGLPSFRYRAVDDLAELFNAMAVDPPYAMAEMSLSFLIMMVAHGDHRLVAIPAFPSRSFRHNQVYVRAASGIQTPAELRGKRVGAPEYHMTAALWIRGFLEHDHGVKPADIHWFVGERNPPRFDFDRPDGVDVSAVGDAGVLDSMLLDGGIDALITSAAPAAYGMGDKRIERLFPAYRDVELDYFRRTGIFPIMHTVVIRRDVYERNPAAAVALLDAFEASKAAARRRLVQLGTLAVMHPWLGAEMAELDATFGGDPFAYGFEANRHVIDAAASLSFEQGLSPRRVQAAELFAPETLAWRAPDGGTRPSRW